MTTPRLASTIDLSLPVDRQRPVTPLTTLARPIRIDAETVKDPEELSNILSGMQLEISSSGASQRSHPEQAPVTFKNVLCGVGGAKVVLAHNFGRNAEYQITKWKGLGTTALYSLICDEDDGAPAITDGNKLALRSYVSGKANIRIWPGT